VYPALAQSEEPDLWTRIERYHVDYKVNTDGSNVRTYEYAIKVLKEQALEGARTHTISHSTSVEAAEVLEAYTVKGLRKIQVPKSNYQLNVNSGRAGGGPAFSDRTTLTVVYPDLAVGDSAVLKYRITQKEPIFPGHFSVRDSFSTSVAYDDVRVAIDAPIALKARYETQAMAQKVTEKKGRRIVEWTWQNAAPVKNKRRDYSVWDVDQQPGYVFSTFDSYAQVAEAYGVRARPKAVPDERIRKLADEIAGDRKEPREQARALYDWVSTKIDYAGNCIGVGVVVPRDLGFVVDNRMGDCKDHTTLLQALLQAKGIASTQALVNSGSAYRLPRVPDVATINHVINYIPAMDLFLDATASGTPFGMLPMSVQDKPVLLVDGGRDGLKTPPMKVGSNRQHMKTVVDVASDGSVVATMDVVQDGLYAAGTREWARNFPKDMETDFVKNVLERGGLRGGGTLEKDDPTALLDTYKFSLKLEIQQLYTRPGAGAFAIAPFFGTTAPVQLYVAGAFVAEEGHESACTSGSSTEEYTYRFPRDMKILSVTDDFELSNDFLTYKATYKLKGNQLTVFRKFDDRTPGNVCPASMAVAYREFAQKVMPNLKAQVLYK
jgi:transglutaminase-like putative cysteine protease